MSERLPYHKASSQVRLEDSIKRTLGEFALIKREDLFHIAQAVIVISCANDCHRHLGIKLGGSVALSTWRIKHILPQLDRHVVLFGVARMVHVGLHTLSLKEAKREKHIRRHCFSLHHSSKVYLLLYCSKSLYLLYELMSNQKLSVLSSSFDNNLQGPYFFPS